MSKVKYVHTNIVAKDWRKLAQFYIKVFGCKKVLPERNMKGKWLRNLTNIDGVHIKGIHLKLPGYDNGPTLEIFSYNKPLVRKYPFQINDIGFAHIAFQVDDIREYIDLILKNGGSFYGEISETGIKDVGHLIVVYMRDPEENIIELQHWN